ncbi:hypothetical protein [Flavobacterium sp.]|jgi:hypothetical protein|uniref:hypothetical protein n=1 Tax=Flavobacterium sp. TaxID=239 RepID=UPI0037BE3268
MKRFFALLLITLVLSGCDDGDLTQVSFDFDDTLAQSCPNADPNNFFIFKTQDKRALIIQLSESNFVNELTADDPNPPLPLEINGSTVRLIYREYSDEIDESAFCSVVPPANLMVLTEREATEGKISITTTAIRTLPDANGATQITHFLHTLVFSDLKFSLGDENNQINEAFTQIAYQTPATPFTNFAGLPNVNSCEGEGNNTFLFKYQNAQALVLDLSDADAAFLFSGAPEVKRREFSSTTILSHLFFDTTFATLNNDYFCANTPPAAPPILETFVAENGVPEVSGIIEVTSLESDNGFKHTIVLKNVRLAKGTLKRDLGNAFIFGEFETTN